MVRKLLHTISLIFILNKKKLITGVTMNVHLLRHIPQCVRSWGPLWAYSCFALESINGVLKRQFHGTRCMNKEVCIA